MTIKIRYQKDYDVNEEEPRALFCFGEGRSQKKGRNGCKDLGQKGLLKQGV